MIIFLNRFWGLLKEISMPAFGGLVMTKRHSLFSKSNPFVKLFRLIFNFVYNSLLEI